MSDQNVGPPPAPPFGGPPGDDPGSAATPQKSRGGRKTLIRIVGVLVVVIVAIGIRLAFSASNDDKTKNAKAGDCISDTTDAKKAKVVDCTSADAKATVLGRVENKSESEVNADGNQGTICTGAGHKDVTQWIWVGKKGGKGYVLCLKDK